jgi:epsilon-lactone hydrolase
VASIESKLFNVLLRLIGKKRFLGRQLASGKPSFFDRPEPISAVRKNCHVHKFQVNGRNIFTLTPKNKPNSSKHVLYLHGGAYIQCFNRFHWTFLARLVEATGCTITAPDYPYAPGHTYKDSFDMATSLYRQMTATINPDEFILMGDSAGGGFALALAQKMRNEKVSLPAHIILLSPWLDIRLVNPGINELEPRDPFLQKKSLRQAGRLYAGDTDPAYYLLSPLNGDLKNLGEISVFMGSKDILAPDARRLKELAELNGIVLNYHEYEDMIHAWMFLNFPESKKVKQQIISLLT